MRLFQIPFSHNCIKARHVLDLKGLSYETVDINPALRGEVKRISGQTLVPMLVDRGHVVSGSTEIALYIDERHREPPLLPDDPQDRAECLILSELRLHFRISAERNRRDEVEARRAARLALDRLADEEHLVGGRLSLADITLAAMAAPLQYAGREVRDDPGVRALLEWGSRTLGSDFSPLPAPETVAAA